MKSPLEAMIPNVKMKDPILAATLDFQISTFQIWMPEMDPRGGAYSNRVYDVLSNSFSN